MAEIRGDAAIRVELLTSAACRYCDDARDLLARLAREYPLAIEVLAIESDRGRQLALAHGILFPPGIFVAGEFVQYGRPSERKLRARLDELAARRKSRA